jgi:hypothetical protein
MSKVTLLYKHEKNNWSVELMSDGTMWILGYHKRRMSSYGHVPVTESVDNLFVPKYVKKMILGVQLEWAKLS